MPEWLELELAHGLAPARAPEALWERIEQGQRPRSARPGWAIAAIVTIMIAAGALWFAAHGQGLGQAELRTANAREIEAWARREAGVELSIPLTGRARLTGVRVFRRNGVAAAEVAYTVGGDRAVLLVARDGGADTVHGGLMWRTGGQVYTLACSNPEHIEGACGLCHANL